MSRFWPFLHTFFWMSNCFKKAIWMCDFWNFHFWLSMGVQRSMFDVWPKMALIWPLDPHIWKLLHSNERTLPNDDLGQFIAFPRQFNSRSIIFPKSPIEKNIYICETHPTSTLILQRKKIFRFCKKHMKEEELYFQKL